MTINSVDSVVDAVLVSADNHSFIAALGDIFVNVFRIITNNGPNSSVTDG
jgi:hypothetical protein